MICIRRRRLRSSRAAHLVDGLSVEKDSAAGRLLQMQDGASECGFAAAALPY